MRTRLRASLFIAIMSGLAGGPAVAEQPTCDVPRELWAQAQELEDQGLYDEAAQIYAGILAQCPGYQRAAIRLAVARFEGGHAEQALQQLDAAMEMDPFGRVWAEWGLLYRARACRTLGCTEQARDDIALLKSRFPDSISTARAEVLEAEMEGWDTGPAEDALELELAAEQLHEEASAAANAGNYDQAVALFDQVVAQYPGTRKSLRSKEIKALMLGLLPDRTEEARAAFEDVLAEVRTTAPHSRLRYEAELRIGFLDLRTEQRPQALARFHWLAAHATSPEVVAGAKLQAAGVYFELLQRRRAEPVQPEQWEALRRLCQEARSHPAATRRDRARADLMVLESLAWEVQPEEALALAGPYLAMYPDAEFRPEQAVVHLFAGESLLRLGRHTEALEHFWWIIDEFADDPGSIWPGLEYRAHTYYRIHASLLRLGAIQEASDICQAILDTYPDTEYADLCRIAAEREGR